MLLLTGAADGSLKVWDRRKLSSSGVAPEAVFSCQHHTAPIMRLEWSPSAANCLATGSEDQVINIWDLARSGTAGADTNSKRAAANIPLELMFQHCGHHGTVGFLLPGSPSNLIHLMSPKWACLRSCPPDWVLSTVRTSIVQVRGSPYGGMHLHTGGSASYLARCTYSML